LPYALYHETICWFIDSTWHCVDGLKKELELVPDSIKKKYIEWRIKFFEWMCKYTKEKQWDDNNMLEEMGNSLTYLKTFLYQKDKKSYWIQ
jgi:hypothetical protein